MKINLKLLLTLFLFSGFIVSAPFIYWFPIFRLGSVAIVFLVVINSLCSNLRNNNKIVIVQFFIISLFLTELFLNNYREFPVDLSILLSMIIALSYLNRTEELIKILKVVVILNFGVMVYETVSSNYLINIVEVNSFRYGRMQGLFAYSKTTGFFLLITFIIFRYFNCPIYFRLIVFFSAIMSGCRTAVLPIAIVLLVDFLYVTHRRISFSNITKNYFYLFSFIGVFLLFSFYYFTSKNEYMLFRILSSFDVETSSQHDRLFFWKSHLSLFTNFNIFEILLGKGTFTNNVIGNGAESTYISILTQIGLAGLCLLLFPLILVMSLVFKNWFVYYPFVILFLFLQVGRVGIGWSDGILLWIIVYYILLDNYKLNFTMYNKGII